jgi:NAD+ kinase
MKKLDHIGIFTIDTKKAVREAVDRLINDPDLKEVRFYRLSLLSPSAFLKRAKVLVSFGGDGTLLSAARLVAKSSIPLIGVNMGGLGFLTDVPAEDANRELKKIFRGRYVREKRMMFDVSLARQGRVVSQDICLNDAVIKGNKLFNLSVLLGREPVSAYNADGMIVSTPTGSTAYSMAAGGPIVFPTLDCMILTPICSHSLTQKPIVCASGRPAVLRIPDTRAKIALSIDGKINHTLRPGDEIRIAQSRYTTVLLKPMDVTYYSILRKKLRWGKD